MGYAVGQVGQIIKTTDGGETWIRQEVHFTNNLHRVRLRDENIGWIIGESGLILFTADGGENWQQQISNSREDLNGIAFIKKVGLCIVGNNSTILTTSDDGLNWQPDSFEFNSMLHHDDDDYFDLNDVFFLDATRGWIGGTAMNKDGWKDGLYLKTQNSGQVWQEVSIVSFNYYDASYSSNSDGFPAGIQQIYFQDLENGICLLEGKLKSTGVKDAIGNVPVSTKNFGTDWMCIMHGAGEHNLQQGLFYFLTGSKVINTGFGGEFRFSYDGGLTWDYPNDYARIFKGIVIGNNGKLLAAKISSVEGIDITKNQKIEKTTLPHADYKYLYSNDFGKNWQSFNAQIFDSTGNELDIPMRLFITKPFIDENENLWYIQWYENSGYIINSKDFGLT